MQTPPNDADTCLAVAPTKGLAADSPPRRLTKKQRAEVESMIVDEGCSRAEALEWVRFSS